MASRNYTSTPPETYVCTQTRVPFLIAHSGTLNSNLLVPLKSKLTCPQSSLTFEGYSMTLPKGILLGHDSSNQSNRDYCLSQFISVTRYVLFSYS